MNVDPRQQTNAEWLDDYAAHDPSAWIVEVDPERAERIAQARYQRGHDNPQQILRDRLQTDRIGAFGELAFSTRFAVPMPELLTSGGDGGVDFRVNFPRRELTFDIKTREQSPTKYLMVPTDKIIKGSAELLVLCQKLEGYRVRLIGWECKSILALEPPKDFGYQRPTYARPVHQLRPMYQLDYLLRLRA